jgi:hypothetical protein
LEQAFLSDIVARLEQAGVKYVLTGSVVSSLWGTPRSTHDVDIVVDLEAKAVRSIVAAFADRYYVSEPAIRDAIARHGMFNIVDSSAGVKADLWVAGQDPFDEELIKRRRQVQIAPGREAFVATPEDVLLHKLVWHTITPSERQLSDAAGIAAVQAGKLDLAYLNGWASKQGTSGLLADVLQGKHLKKT